MDRGRGVRSRGLETYFILYCDFDLVNSVFPIYSRGGRRSASKAEGEGKAFITSWTIQYNKQQEILDFSFKHVIIHDKLS